VSYTNNKRDAPNPEPVIRCKAQHLDTVHSSRYKDTDAALRSIRHPARRCMSNHKYNADAYTGPLPGRG